MHPDLLIIGGGAVGLSLADCALRRGLKVTVLDRTGHGLEASWAGAGMLTCRPRPKQNPAWTDHFDLALLGVRLHAQWHQRLLSEVGMDTGYRVCGAIELLPESPKAATSSEEPESSNPPHHHDPGPLDVEALLTGCKERGVSARRIDLKQARELEPSANVDGYFGALEFPNEAQVRSPWFTRALMASIKKQGGTLEADVDVADIDITGGKANGVVLRNGKHLPAGAVAVCAGAWSGQFPTLIEVAPVCKKIQPVRGQMLCYQTDAKLAKRLLTCSRHYVVPRGDGMLLVGATHEYVGFEKSMTEAGYAELEKFGQSLLPALKALKPAHSWAGLRPGLKGKHPLLGPVPKVPGLYVACGHYRDGIAMAPATGHLLGDVICGRKPEMPITHWAITNH
jgi:glycine oxidase